MTKHVRTIVVVCRGNIARSPFAEAVIRRELSQRGLDRHFQVLSRGVQGTFVDPEPVKHPNITYYPQIYLPVMALLAQLDIDLTTHTSKIITSQDVRNASVLLAMDEEVRNKLKKLFPEFASKTHLISEITTGSENITDPEGIANAEQLTAVSLDVRQKIVSGFPELLKLASK